MPNWFPSLSTSHLSPFRGRANAGNHAHLSAACRFEVFSRPPRTDERTSRGMRRGRDLSPAGPGRQPAVSRAGARGNLPADAADAAGHPEPRPTGGRHDHLRPPSQPADRHLQGRGQRQRGLPPEPSRQVREPDGGVRRPGGHRPRPLRHLRPGRPQLRPALRAAPHQEAQVVQLRLQRPIGQLHGPPRGVARRRRQLPRPRDRHRSAHAPDLQRRCRPSGGRR